jgi:hypothetical protein
VDEGQRARRVQEVDGVRRLVGYPQPVLPVQERFPPLLIYLFKFSCREFRDYRQSL